MKNIVLWNGQYRPEDITPEYIQSLSISEALNLLSWLNRYAQEETA